MLDVTLTSSSLWFASDKEVSQDNYATRNCVRVVVYKKDGTIALSRERFESLEEFYGLPWGGIDEGESEEDALIREIKEEVGCTIMHREKIGLVTAVKWYNRRTTYHNVYTAQYEHDLWELTLTDHEKTYVYEIVRVSIDTAIELIERCMEAAHEYEKWMFILARDHAILSYIRANNSL